MANQNKTARNSGNYSTPKTSTYRKEDMPIITREYQRGARYAGWLLVGMFVVLSIGSWWLGW